MAHAKLAPIQVVSHGHPVTSGISADVMDYYVSWAAAELEYDVAKTHYSEELVLLPNTSMHQYYERRATDTASNQNGFNFQTLVDKGRASLFPNIPADGHWYVCMQKPFKIHPEMAPLICNVLAIDPLGRAILHADDTRTNTKILHARLINAGCDMDRVHFVPVQPHHRLLALYKLSTLILDSFPAGGCTTTREILEMGKVAVTWPARLLGGRWTLAYYTMMGDDVLTEMVVADSEESYVALAVKLGTDDDLREEAERRIRASFPNLMGRMDSVKAWENVFLQIAPVQLADEHGKCSNAEHDEL